MRGPQSGKVIGIKPMMVRNLEPAGRVGRRRPANKKFVCFTNGAGTGHIKHSLFSMKSIKLWTTQLGFLPPLINTLQGKWTTLNGLNSKKNALVDNSRNK